MNTAKKIGRPPLAPELRKSFRVAFCTTESVGARLAHARERGYTDEQLLTLGLQAAEQWLAANGVDNDNS